MLTPLDPCENYIEVSVRTHREKGSLTKFRISFPPGTSFLTFLAFSTCKPCDFFGELLIALVGDPDLTILMAVSEFEMKE